MKKGSFYVEIMISLMMVGVIATSFLPLLPELLKKTRHMNRVARLESITQYCGSYLFRWVNYSRKSKLIPFSFFKENDELELTGEHRVNRLLWALPPEFKEDYLSDHYKVSIAFKDTVNRSISAGIHTVVWYDENLNNVLDNNELNISFSTVITEKEPPL
ncbi:hypothetical protein DID78_03950 [Candidatus Marinamargulisbacteria bacterium SCGC AG-343-D04]|nr:hypothetical protein DID78_03950 [Candidatus Marinamargulisbacteria bacterium SCGC AG-343-D04]